MIYRRRYWIVILPLFTTLLAIYNTRNIPKTYEVNTTIYTGIASGFTIESGIEGARVDWSSVKNGIDNLISIIMSKSTLRNVSLRLYAQHMIYGDSLRDNNYITAENFRSIYRITPKEVRQLIDKTSVDNTIENLNAYERSSPKNFVYGLFNWYHRHYSYNSLKKIVVKRVLDSDMIDIEYSADDPGVAYHTLLLLNTEFVKQYEILRFGQTNSVVDYFRNELAQLEMRLKSSEDSLTLYNIEKRIINYSEQTKQVADLSAKYALEYMEVQLAYSSADAAVSNLEKRIDKQIKIIQNNTQFTEKIREMAALSSQISRIELMGKDSIADRGISIGSLIKQRQDVESELRKITSSINEDKFTKEGVASVTFVEEWINEYLLREKTRAQLDVINEIVADLQDEYTYFSPIGSTLKRKERIIDFTEKSYLAILESLNAALMRQKTLQMTSANLKPIDPPLFPISPSSKRRIIILIVFGSTIAFIAGFFAFLELFDRTIRDKFRAERLIGTTVLGAFPKKFLFQYKRYNAEYEKIATNTLANSIIPFLNPKEGPDIINFLSVEDGTGKSRLTRLLYDYWTDRGLKIRVISWHDEEPAISRDYVISQNLSNIYDIDNYDIILVEHRALLKSAVPAGLLKEASLNLLVLRSDKVWRDIDKIIFERLTKSAERSPLQVYLTNVSRHDVETFTGMLPPHSFLRKLIYKILQFGLTSN